MLGVAALVLAGTAPAHAQPWSRLSPQEQRILSPLQRDWDRLEPQRKDKWRGLAQRYPQMSPPEQERM